MIASPFKAALLIFLFGYGLVYAGATNESAPLLVIWQQSEYPVPGREPKYLHGLVAVVWPDGRVIRATDKKTIGGTYTEGHASRKEFTSFLQFLTSPAILSMPDEFAVIVDSASRSITIRHAGKKHNWTRTIPDEQRALNEIEARTWTLPLEGAINLNPKKTDLRRFRDQ